MATLLRTKVLARAREGCHCISLMGHLKMFPAIWLVFGGSRVRREHKAQTMMTRVSGERMMGRHIEVIGSVMEERDLRGRRFYIYSFLAGFGLETHACIREPAKLVIIAVHT